jgi:hypothetical protein
MSARECSAWATTTAYSHVGSVALGPRRPWRIAPAFLWRHLPHDERPSADLLLDIEQLLASLIGLALLLGLHDVLSSTVLATTGHRGIYAAVGQSYRAAGGRARAGARLSDSHQRRGAEHGVSYPAGRDQDPQPRAPSPAPPDWSRTQRRIPEASLRATSGRLRRRRIGARPGRAASARDRSAPALLCRAEAVIRLRSSRALGSRPRRVS